MLDVVPHRLDQLVRAVADGGGGVQFIVQVGAVVIVGVAAGGGDGGAGGHQAGAPVLAPVDGVPDGLVHKAVAAHHTQAGKAGHQVGVGALQSGQCPVGDGLIGLGGGGVGLSVHRQMHMAVAQAGGDEPVPQIDNLAALQIGLGQRGDRCDPLAVDEDHHVLPHLAGLGIEHSGTLERFVSHNRNFLSFLSGGENKKEQKAGWRSVL